MKEPEQECRWRIELTEEQLYVLIEAVEDWHRFLCGQCELANATSYIDSAKVMHNVREILHGQVKPVMFPELNANSAYSWHGGQPNPHHSRAAAISYLLYREARHQLAAANERWSVYDGATLTCDEQGPMIKFTTITD